MNTLLSAIFFYQLIFSFTVNNSFFENGNFKDTDLQNFMLKQ